MRVSPNHPRFRSLVTRERLVNGFEKGIVVPQGLIAHGRGEAFDYMFGETTPASSRSSIKTAAALLLGARNPIISVNGNTAALVAKDIVKLGRIIPARLEVNLYHNSLARKRRIASLLKQNCASYVIGVNSSRRSVVKGVASQRRYVDSEGIGQADVVLIPLEDGDRAEALRNAGKTVIAIDLNPLSRTSRSATVTIVDNIIRAIPELLKVTRKMKTFSSSRLQKVVEDFENESNLGNMMKEMMRHAKGWT
jgi:4-phosphopantoate--beta-alanine ligase